LYLLLGLFILLTPPKFNFLNPSFAYLPISFQNNNCISQPINVNNVPNNSFNINNNILDDFLEELENEEKEKNKINFDKNDKPIENELKGLFERRKYNAYFQMSRTQNQQFSNIWDDFHQKRDKL
jgi:hypothetical protein